MLRGGPWAFEKALLALKEPGSKQPSRIVVDTIPFWIRVYDLPVDAMTIETAEAIYREGFWRASGDC